MAPKLSKILAALLDDDDEAKPRTPAEKASDGRPICRTYRSTQACSYGTSCRFAHLNNLGQVVNPVAGGQPGAAPTPQAGQGVVQAGAVMVDGVKIIECTTPQPATITLVDRMKQEAQGCKLNSWGLNGSQRAIEITLIAPATLAARLVRRDEAGNLFFIAGALPMGNEGAAQQLLDRLSPKSPGPSGEIGLPNAQRLTRDMVKQLDDLKVGPVETEKDDSLDVETTNPGMTLKGISESSTDFFSGLKAVLETQTSTLLKTVDERIAKSEVSSGPSAADAELRRRNTQMEAEKLAAEKAKLDADMATMKAQREKQELELSLANQRAELHKAQMAAEMQKQQHEAALMEKRTEQRHQEMELQRQLQAARATSTLEKEALQSDLAKLQKSHQDLLAKKVDSARLFGAQSEEILAMQRDLAVQRENMEREFVATKQKLMQEQIEAQEQARRLQQQQHDQELQKAALLQQAADQEVAKQRIMAENAAQAEELQRKHMQQQQDLQAQLGASKAQQDVDLQHKQAQLKEFKRQVDDENERRLNELRAAHDELKKKENALRWTAATTSALFTTGMSPAKVFSEAEIAGLAPSSSGIDKPPVLSSAATPQVKSVAPQTTSEAKELAPPRPSASEKFGKRSAPRSATKSIFSSRKAKTTVFKSKLQDSPGTSEASGAPRRKRMVKKAPIKSLSEVAPAELGDREMEDSEIESTESDGTVDFEELPGKRLDFSKPIPPFEVGEDRPGLSLGQPRLDFATGTASSPATDLPALSTAASSTVPPTSATTLTRECLRADDTVDPEVQRIRDDARQFIDYSVQQPVLATEEDLAKRRELPMQLADLEGNLASEHKSLGPSKLCAYDPHFVLCGVPVKMLGRAGRLSDQFKIPISSGSMEGWALHYTQDDLRNAFQELPDAMLWYRAQKKGAEKMKDILKTWGLCWTGLLRRLPLLVAYAILVAHAKQERPAAFFNQHTEELYSEESKKAPLPQDGEGLTPVGTSTQGTLTLAGATRVASLTGLD